MISIFSTFGSWRLIFFSWFQGQVRSRLISQKVEAKLKENEEKAEILTKHWLHKNTEAQKIFKVWIRLSEFWTFKSWSKPYLGSNWLCRHLWILCFSFLTIVVWKLLSYKKNFGYKKIDNFREIIILNEMS